MGGEALEKILIFLSVLLLFVTCPITIWFCFKAVKEYERLVIFRLGRIRKGARGPGCIFLLPCTDSYRLIDLRLSTYNVPPQEILTRDSVTVHVDAVVYFKVVNAEEAVLKISSYSAGTNLLSATSLRNELGTKNLAEVLTDREAISIAILNVLDEATEKWGVKVERVEIKDVSLPLSMQRAMAAEGEATREAKAKVIAAKGELNASQSLKEASDIIAANPAALQLRYLQTLASIGSEQNRTIIFPLPVDIIGSIIPGFGKSSKNA